MGSSSATRHIAVEDLVFEVKYPGPTSDYQIKLFDLAGDEITEYTISGELGEQTICCGEVEVAVDDLIIAYNQMIGIEDDGVSEPCHTDRRR